MEKKLIVAVGMMMMLVGCGGEASPSETCSEVSKAVCGRFFECYTTVELANVESTVGKSEPACIVKLETELGCSARTEELACDEGETYDSAAAESCPIEVNDLSCSVFRETGLKSLDNGACGDMCKQAR